MLFMIFAIMEERGKEEEEREEKGRGKKIMQLLIVYHRSLVKV